MVRRLLALAVLACLAVLAPRTARADIPPDPDSVDAHCTRAEQCPTGETCPYTFDPKSDSPDVAGELCRADMLRKGLEQRCSNGGNYSGDHLFCPPGASGSWTPPGQPKPETKPAPTPEPAPAPEPKPEPAPVQQEPAPARQTATPDVTAPARASMCSLGGSPGLLALLLLARRRRR